MLGILISFRVPAYFQSENVSFREGKHEFPVSLSFSSTFPKRDRNSPDLPARYIPLPPVAEGSRWTSEFPNGSLPRVVRKCEFPFQLVGWFPGG